MLRRALGFLIFAGSAFVCLPAQRSGPSVAPSLPASGWQLAGPALILSPSYGALSGRVGSLALDSSDATGNTLYVGALGGGVWKSANAASRSPTFDPLTDSLSVWQSGATPSLSIGAITVQPRVNGVVLAGTGDANNALDSHYGSGILRSTDGGASWTLVQNTQDAFNGGRTNFSFIGEGFNGFAWSALTPGLVVAAVGGSANATNAARLGFSGRGLFYSTDAGATWQLATIRDSATAVVQSSQTDFSAYQGNDATSVVWNAVRKRFVAAVRYHGYYDSPDGITWTRLATQPGAGLTTLFCPTNPGLPASTQCPLFRGALTVDAVSGDTFALSVDAGNKDQGLWRDICNQHSGNCAAPLAFLSRLDTTALDSSATSGQIIGGDYALTLATAHTATETLLFAGTQDLFRCSLTAGCTWRNTTNSLGCAAAGVAAAQHAIVVSGATMFFATDGGVWRTTDAVAEIGAVTGAVCSTDDAAHFQNLNAGLGSLAEITSFAQNPTDGGVLLASAGRNGITGTAATTETQWNQISASAFNPVAIDQQTPANWYAETDAGVNISRCASGIGCLQTKFADPPVIGSTHVSGDKAALNAPFLLDRANQTHALVGTCRLWRGLADGAGWSAANAISTMFDGHPQPSCEGNSIVRSIAAAGPASLSGSKVIYVGMAAGGTVGGHVFANYAADQATGATVWTDIALSSVANDVANAGRFNVAGFDVSSVTVDTHDATGKTVYATIAGFSGNGISAPLVYRSTDGGAHWQNITSNLPDAPANALLVDALDPNTIYVALDSGIYVTNTVTSCALPTANCWSSYAKGLPTAPVTSLLQIAVAGQSVLRAGTLGRGIWQTGATTIANPGRITLSPSGLTFAQQGVGTTSAAQNVTLTNAGGAPVTVIALTVSPNFTASTGCAAPLASQATCTIQVSFTPTAAGSISGTLSVTDGVTPQSLTLNGTAAIIASFIVSPDSVGFPTTAVGSVSASQDVTVVNIGGSTLTGFSAATSAEFEIAAGGTCTSTIPPNLSCTVRVAFAPTRVESITGTLTVSATDAPSQTVMLLGNAINASLVATPANLSFATTGVKTISASQAVIVTNPSAASLAGFSATTTGDFKIVVGGTCTATLAPNASCSVLVVFAPNAAGSRTGALTMVAEGVHTQSVTLTGTGIDFTLTIVGSSSSTIKAGGAATYTLAVTPAAGSLGFASLSCNGLPLHTTCLMDSSMVSLAGASTVKLSIGTSSNAAANPVPGAWMALAVPFGLPLMLYFGRRRGRRLLSRLGVILAGVIISLAAGCGAGTAKLIGGSGGPGVTTPGNYTFVVTAASAGITRIATLTLVVQ